MRAGRRFSRLDSYAVDEAGAQIGLSRAGSYRAAQRGDLPTEKDGRFLRVPRRRWNRIRNKILRIEKEAT
jgi:hypothetical protein